MFATLPPYICTYGLTPLQSTPQPTSFSALYSHHYLSTLVLFNGRPFVELEDAPWVAGDCYVLAVIKFKLMAINAMIYTTQNTATVDLWNSNTQQGKARCNSWQTYYLRHAVNNQGGSNYNTAGFIAYDNRVPFLNSPRRYIKSGHFRVASFFDVMRIFPVDWCQAYINYSLLLIRLGARTQTMCPRIKSILCNVKWAQWWKAVFKSTTMPMKALTCETLGN